MVRSPVQRVQSLFQHAFGVFREEKANGLACTLRRGRSSVAENVVLMAVTLRFWSLSLISPEPCNELRREQKRAGLEQERLELSKKSVWRIILREAPAFRAVSAKGFVGDSYLNLATACRCMNNLVGWELPRLWRQLRSSRCSEVTRQRRDGMFRAVVQHSVIMRYRSWLHATRSQDGWSTQTNGRKSEGSASHQEVEGV